MVRNKCAFTVSPVGERYRRNILVFEALSQEHISCTYTKGCMKFVNYYYGQREISSSCPFNRLTTIRSRKTSTLKCGRSVMAYFTYRGGLRPALTDDSSQRSDAYSRMMTATQDLDTTLGEGAQSSRHTGTNVSTTPLPIAFQGNVQSEQ